MKLDQEQDALMSKYAKDAAQGFGSRLAKLRKAAGYTQHQLAEEIGVTRRMIVYYETESEHPPTTLLADLARALNVTSDQLLGITPVKTVKAGSRLERRLKQIEKMGPGTRRQITQLIDAFIEREQLKRSAG